MSWGKVLTKEASGSVVHLQFTVLAYLILACHS